MEIDVIIDKENLSIKIENPFHFDTKKTIKKIIDFGQNNGVQLLENEIESLILRLIRGVAGCENDCPADALTLARSGFRNFKVEYTDGGILSAKSLLRNNRIIEIKVFPDF